MPTGGHFPAHARRGLPFPDAKLKAKRLRRQDDLSFDRQIGRIEPQGDPR
jgi:hypothetical protein